MNERLEAGAKQLLNILVEKYITLLWICPYTTDEQLIRQLSSVSTDNTSQNIVQWQNTFQKMQWHFRLEKTNGHGLVRTPRRQFSFISCFFLYCIRLQWNGVVNKYCALGLWQYIVHGKSCFTAFASLNPAAFFTVNGLHFSCTLAWC